MWPGGHGAPSPWSLTQAWRVIASPNASKPGPRLADDPGALTVVTGPHPTRPRRARSPGVRSGHGHATGGGQGLAGDEAGVLGGEEDDGRGHVGRGGQP